MATSAKILAPDKPNPAEDWTVVLPRRGKQKRNYHKVIIRDREKQEQTWTPADTETNPERESKLMQKIQTCMKKLESSPFWLTFSDQLQTPEIFDWFLKFGGSEGKMQMVIYGIGSVESYEPPRLQLSLAILMKRMFSWIGEVEVFDPVISLAESRVLAALGCSVLTVNEQGRRQALRPTMFFMPHCEAELYDNLLEANWSADLLNNIVLFGNSFEAYEQHLSVCKNLTLADSRKHILAIRQFVKEYGINSFSDDFFRAFHGRNGQPSPGMTWSTRLKIAKGTARGLAYLHECSPRKFVHGDIKPSNILLDNELQPYVSDFGLNRLINITGNNPSSSGGFMGGALPYLKPAQPERPNNYRAPEARIPGNRPTQKWDVYSFGVVLLELLTGKSPDLSIPTTSTSIEVPDLVRWVRKGFEEQNPLSDMVEPMLLQEVSAKKEVLAVFHVALACTEADPEIRPRMKTVSENIEKIGS